MGKIHPTALISEGCNIDTETVEIGPYAVIEGNAVIHPGCRIGPHVHVQGYTEIGRDCSIATGAVIGSPTQDLKYRGGKTYLKIGEKNSIREFVTINTGTGENETTVIGSNCLIMAYAHIAHNCIIGNNVIIANAGTLAGHVEIGDFAIIGGLAGIHQFCRVGMHSIIGGCSKITKDIIPFVMSDGHPAKPRAVNKVGLKRRNFEPGTISMIEKAYKILFRSGLNISAALSEIEDMANNRELAHIVTFIKNSRRGIAK